jgi:hypothetical protein
MLDKWAGENDVPLGFRSISEVATQSVQEALCEAPSTPLRPQQPEQRIPILSELHKHIQDAFNEHGVQIMSPHFEMQPPQRVLVPKSQWFAEPAEAPAMQNDGKQSPEASPEVSGYIMEGE